jgi:hypothetical protein
MVAVYRGQGRRAMLPTKTTCPGSSPGRLLPMMAMI